MTLSAWDEWRRANRLFSPILCSMATIFLPGFPKPNLVTQRISLQAYHLLVLLEAKSMLMIESTIFSQTWYDQIPESVGTCRVKKNWQRWDNAVYRPVSVHERNMICSTSSSPHNLKAIWFEAFVRTERSLLGPFIPLGWKLSQVFSDSDILMRLHILTCSPGASALQVWCASDTSDYTSKKIPACCVCESMIVGYVSITPCWPILFSVVRFWNRRFSTVFFTWKGSPWRKFVSLH